MRPSGSAQYSGRAAMMAKVASMAGTSAENSGATVRLGSPENGINPSLFSPDCGHTVRFPPCAFPPPRGVPMPPGRRARPHARDIETGASRVPGKFSVLRRFRPRARQPLPPRRASAVIRSH